MREEISELFMQLEHGDEEEKAKSEAMTNEILELRDLALTLQRELAKTQKRLQEAVRFSCCLTSGTMLLA
jgi:hypothetical protein